MIAAELAPYPVPRAASGLLCTVGSTLATLAAPSSARYEFDTAMGLFKMLLARGMGV